MSITWKFLAQYVLKPTYPISHYFPVARSPQTQSRYQKYQANLRETGVSLSQHILDKYFSDDREHIITPNEFPYDTPSDVDHYILWIHPGHGGPGGELQDNFPITYINRLIDTYRQLHGYQDMLYFRNFITDQTIPGIPHFQIFFRC